jgi:hypothetical protein
LSRRAGASSSELLRRIGLRRAGASSESLLLESRGMAAVGASRFGAVAAFRMLALVDGVQ